MLPNSRFLLKLNKTKQNSQEHHNKCCTLHYHSNTYIFSFSVIPLSCRHMTFTGRLIAGISLFFDSSHIHTGFYIVLVSGIHQTNFLIHFKLLAFGFEMHFIHQNSNIFRGCTFESMKHQCNNVQFHSHDVQSVLCSFRSGGLGCSPSQLWPPLLPLLLLSQTSAR